MGSSDIVKGKKKDYMFRQHLPTRGIARCVAGCDGNLGTFVFRFFLLYGQRVRRLIFAPHGVRQQISTSREGSGPPCTSREGSGPPHPAHMVARNAVEYLLIPAPRIIPLVVVERRLLDLYNTMAEDVGPRDPDNSVYTLARVAHVLTG